MNPGKLFHFIGLSLLYFMFINISAFAQEYEADDLSSFMDAISRANSSPQSEHKININDNITLDSPINEAVSLELAGSNSSSHYNLSLNGNSFTYNGAGKSSKISDLNVLLDTSDCGIFVNNQTMTVKNTNFTSNLSNNSNGFIKNSNGTLIISQSDFTGNTNRLGAGAIHNSGTVTLNMADSVITKNKGDQGGGIYFNNGTADIKNSELSNNKSSRDGGAIYVNDGEFNISDSTLKNNTATTTGGALYVNSGTTVTIDNTSFDNNNVEQASRGGAINNNGTMIIQNGSSFTNNFVEKGSSGAIANAGTLTIDKTLFDNNYAYNEGGAISDNGHSTITNSKFSNNSSKGSFAGALIGYDLKIDNTIFDNNSAYNFGGAVVAANNAVITNSTFTNNKSETSSGGALVNLYGNVDLGGANIFNSNSAKENGGAIHSTYGSVTTITGTAEFSDNTAETGYGGAIFTQGIVNINADNADSPIIFSGNKDSTGSNAFHLDINPDAEGEVGTINLNVSNGAKIILEDNISGIAGTQLNINGTSAQDDNVYLGSANDNFKGKVSASNINLNFYNEMSGLANAQISAANTNFNF